MKRLLDHAAIEEPVQRIVVPKLGSLDSLDLPVNVAIDGSAVGVGSIVAILIGTPLGRTLGWFPSPVGRFVGT